MGLHSWLWFLIIFGSLQADLLISLTKSKEMMTICKNYDKKLKELDDRGIQMQLDWNGDECPKLSADFKLTNPTDPDATCHFNFSYANKTVNYFYNDKPSPIMNSDEPLIMLKSLVRDNQVKTVVISGDQENTHLGGIKCWNGSAHDDKLCYDLTYETKINNCVVVLNTDADIMLMSLGQEPLKLMPTNSTASSVPERTEEELHKWWIWAIAVFGALLLLAIIAGLIWFIVVRYKKSNSADDDDADAEKGTQTDAGSEKTSKKSNDDEKTKSTNSEITTSEETSSESKYIGTPPVAVSSHRVKKKKT